MGHVHIQWKRNKKNHKIIQGHPNKNIIQNVKHNTKYSEPTSTKRQRAADSFITTTYTPEDGRLGRNM
jgi:hypothetical protein